MNVRIDPHELSGSIEAIPSKSVAHRMAILAGLSEGITDLVLPSSSQDIDATLRCLQSLGASIGRTHKGFRIVPLGMRGAKPHAQLDVGESGSTLRFLLPIVAALGKGATIMGHGRLAERPLAPLDDELIAHGITLSERGVFPLEVSGHLAPGRFQLPGSVSSQFASGLLMAAPLLDDAVTIDVLEPVESKGYIDLTVAALKRFGVGIDESRSVADGLPCRSYHVAWGQRITSPGTLAIEGDWSNAAFWLAAGALQKTPLMVSGLDLASRQGDRAIMAALSLLGARMGRTAGLVSSTRESLHGHDLDVSAIPDLAAPLAAVASVADGTTRLRNAGRLRLKESDRLITISTTINTLGGKASVEGDDLVFHGVRRLRGGIVDAAGDHRIAMLAAICATQAEGPTTICGADCVSKSYPGFFEDLASLGGLVHREEL